jgi:hypothetical protein
MGNKDSSGLIPYIEGTFKLDKQEFALAADWYLSSALLQESNIDAWIAASTMLFPQDGKDYNFA